MNNKPLYFIVFNALWFQVGWWSLILYPQWALPVTGALLMLHLGLTPQRKADLITLAVVVPIGAAFDSIMQIFGVIQFALSATEPTVVPVWLLCLWCVFACTTNHALAWLRRLPALWVGLFGGVSAAGSYYAGAKLGAADIPGFAVFWLLYLAFWAISLLGLYKWFVPRVVRANL